jgi:hypothetical protein
MTSLHSRGGGVLAAAFFSGAVLIGTASCTADATPTGVEATPAPLAVSDNIATAFRAAVQDARERVLPGIGTDGSGQAIGPSLDALGAAVVARDATALRRAIAATEAALADFENRAKADDAELAAVRLVVDYARALAAGEQTLGRDSPCIGRAAGPRWRTL